MSAQPVTAEPGALLDALRAERIIPQVLTEDLNGLSNATQLDIIYGPEYGASTGEILPRSATQSIPELKLLNAGRTQPLLDRSATYTIIMTDPDLFKEHDTMSGQVRHWLQTQAKVDESGFVRLDGSAVVSDYVGPAPGPGTGYHRYIFILLRENSPPDASSLLSKYRGSSQDLKERMGFDAGQYIKDHDVQTVGVGWMRVSADTASTVENLRLAAESVAHKVVGQ